jgi:hypothetical protein
MTAIRDMHASISRPSEKWCADCRFGAGYPQGPRGLMRCVNLGHPTIGQFLRGPVACEGFQERDTRIERPHAPAAPTWVRCGDCGHADLFTVEPACACALVALGSHRRVRALDAPACASFTARLRPDLTLHASRPHAFGAARRPRRRRA